MAYHVIEPRRSRCIQSNPFDRELRKKESHWRLPFNFHSRKALLCFHVYILLFFICNVVFKCFNEQYCVMKNSTHYLEETSVFVMVSQCSTNKIIIINAIFRRGFFFSLSDEIKDYVFCGYFLNHSGLRNLKNIFKWKSIWILEEKILFIQDAFQFIGWTLLNNFFQMSKYIFQFYWFYSRGPNCS